MFTILIITILAHFVHNQYPPNTYPQFLAIPIPPGSSFRFAYPPRYNGLSPNSVAPYSPFNLPLYPPPPPPLVRPTIAPAIASTVCKNDKPPRLDYKDCPQFEEKEEDKKMKEEKSKECFKDINVSENSTREELNPTLQNSLDECLLRKKELVSKQLNLFQSSSLNSLSNQI